MSGGDNVRDVARWQRPTYYYRGLDHFQASENLTEGLHSIGTKGVFIDILYEPRNAPTTLVFFNAATRDRPGRKLPIFTGGRISQQATANRIYVNDPGLYRDPKLALGWYAGTKDLSQGQIGSVIRRFVDAASGSRTVYFGISGGGFAALYYSHNLADTLAVAVNPQTDIAKFNQRAIREYVRACRETPSSSALAKFDSDLTCVYGPGHENGVLYLQNSRDHHVGLHLRPFARAVGLEYETGDAEHGRLAVVTGEWGEGHTAPPRDLLARVLTDVASWEGSWSEFLHLQNLETIRESRV